MRLLMSAALVAAAAYLASHVPGRSAPEAAAGSAGPLELVVFEHPDCSYCPAFRRNVAQRYQASSQSADAPLRFVDVAAPDAGRFELKLPISVVPTAVLVRNGREVDRIAGYWAPDNFLKMIAYIRAKAE
jgi:thiol-disulfide isomerase/thioredoxin